MAAPSPIFWPAHRLRRAGRRRGLAELSRGQTVRAKPVLVPEDEILVAVAFAFQRLGLVIEPSAAVVLAAVCSGRLAVDAHTCWLSRVEISTAKCCSGVWPRAMRSRRERSRALG